ncbi:iron-sulfur protein [Streptomyces nigrescens]|uniref:Iron-sulfur protein n=2 Tax=Streptomyces TaxID=1883 RepID=A0ABM7ZN22_STRNI|nr:PDR/VanB family oxidoreductase [Streptomyces nigrescens]MEE4425266.1 PDR/VanB family oxidoreductase [Streptomyces sp. DSM 41528]BDM67785.1 iron-sulfur protein [Streptomyces nigrescens]
MPRIGTVVAVGAAALVVRRALRRRVQASPLWPLPALDEPISGRGRAGGRADARRLTVVERTTEAEGVLRLRLEGTDLPAWEPGAHVDLVLPSGAVRQYSLCGDPAARGSYTLAVRLVEDGRGGSREVHERLHEGTEVEVRGPRNRFPLADSHAHVFIAGGIGITPILPMVRQAEREGVPWRLLYGGRSRASMPFLAEIEKLAGAGADRVTVVAEDEDGRPDLAALLAGAPPHAAVHCCGPQPLMDAVAALLPDGLTLHTERFAPAAPAPAGEERPFEVELRRTGRTVTVPAGTSVLRALREQALPDLPYSCEQGFCGTCQQRVLAGEVDHRDELLTDAERDDSLLICVSRARGGARLVLDL